MFNIANVIIQSGINRLGSDVVAASTIGVTAEIFVYYLLNSFGQASMTFNGQNYGAGNLRRCRSATRWCLLLGGILSEAFALLAGGFWSALCRDLHFGRGASPCWPLTPDALGAALPVVQHGH